PGRIGRRPDAEVVPVRARQGGPPSDLPITLLVELGGERVGNRAGVRRLSVEGHRALIFEARAVRGRDVPDVVGEAARPRPYPRLTGGDGPAAGLDQPGVPDRDLGRGGAPAEERIAMEQDLTVA